MDDESKKKFLEYRKELCSLVIRQIQNKGNIYPYQNGKNLYFKDNIHNKVELSNKAGIYVFYSKKRQQPVYVGETENLKNRIRTHCKLSNKSNSSNSNTGSTLKDNWTPFWLSKLGKGVSEVDIVDFIHNYMFIRYMEIPFGRKEIEEDLQNKWNIKKRENIDPNIFI